ncbi:hypothetical protein CRG98_018061 [Punica granatum]|uniref:Uncharacterized protein n=1 Tax=Punica granatum TaxID=22663 RepID=A0A2I0JZ24_PUNGR|nr:hypothetical protein CRG98_018061 [Punica granatum]
MEIGACHASLPKLLGVTSTNNTGQSIGPTSEECFYLHRTRISNLTSYTSASEVEGHPISQSPKISQIESSRPQPREWPGRNRGGHTSPEPFEQGSSGDIALPQENRPEGDDLEDGEEALWEERKADAQNLQRPWASIIAM